MDTPMHPNTFQKLFLPIPEEPTNGRPRIMPRPVVNEILKAKSAGQLSKIWAKWLNPVTAKGPCPGYNIVVSEPKASAAYPFSLKADGAFHRKSDTPTDERSRWEAENALWEFQGGDDINDPFHDITGDGQSDANEYRAPASEHIIEAFHKQHRTSMFVFLVNGTKMRVTRWDRSGTIFTESFDYTENRKLLRDVLWGFSLLSEESQGQDMTATALRPEDPDFQIMDEVARPCDTDIPVVEGTAITSEGPYTFAYVRQAFADSLSDLRYRVEVPCEGGSRSFLVGRPFVVGAGVSGRGSRGYVAWDPVLRRFVFLKDAWRPHYENVQTEGKVLRALNEAGVVNVPTYVCDGELDPVAQTSLHGPMTQPASNKVIFGKEGLSALKDDRRPQSLAPPCQQSSTSDLVNRGKNIVQQFRHYRVVVKEMCLPLHKFNSGKQLISIVRDCVEAHAGAVKKGKILHCDVSGGNMLIHPTVVIIDGVKRVVHKGVLTDWELSMSLDPADEDPRTPKPVRTGTWQFTSVNILDHHDKPSEVADEIEAFFHVTLYHAMRYLRNTCSNLELAMFDYFERCEVEDDRYFCNERKRESMRGGRLYQCGGKPISFGVGEHTSHPINSVFGIMLSWFKIRYHNLKLAQPTRKKKRVNIPGFELADSSATTSTSTAPKHVDRLEDHTAVLDLLEKALAMPTWPTNDKVGDQLNPPQSLSTTNSNDNNTDIETQDDGGPSKREAPDDESEQPPRKRLRSQSRGRKKGEAQQNLLRAAKTVRTRGDRANNASGSRSTYNLRPRKSRR